MCDRQPYSLGCATLLTVLVLTAATVGALGLIVYQYTRGLYLWIIR